MRQKTLTIETSMPSEDVLCLKIADSGCGIPSAHLDRIFDPFFTTKARWNSTGVGLSLVHKVLEEHRAKIDVDSQEGVGTCFRIRFPLQRNQLAAQTPGPGQKGMEA